MSGDNENSTNWKKILFCNELKHVNFYVFSRAASHVARFYQLRRSVHSTSNCDHSWDWRRSYLLWQCIKALILSTLDENLGNKSCLSKFVNSLLNNNHPIIEVLSQIFELISIRNNLI